MKLIKRGYGLRGKEFTHALPEPPLPREAKLAALKMMLGPTAGDIQPIGNLEDLAKKEKRQIKIKP